MSSHFLIVVMFMMKSSVIDKVADKKPIKVKPTKPYNFEGFIELLIVCFSFDLWLHIIVV